KDIGICNFNLEQLSLVYRISHIKPATLQIECHAYLSQDGLVDFCKNHNIIVECQSPLARPDKKLPCCVSVPPLLLNPVIVNIAKVVNKTPAQVCIRWLLQRGLVVIERTFTPKHILENFAVYDFSLTNE